MSSTASGEVEPLSSDAQLSSSQQAADGCTDALFRIKCKVTVKPYINAQYRSSVVLAEQAINVSTMEDFINAVLELVHENVEGLAFLANDQDVQRYSLQEGPVTIDNLNSFVLFKHSNHFYSINDTSDRQPAVSRNPFLVPAIRNAYLMGLGISTTTLQRWTHHSSAPELFIYKFGTSLQNAAEYKAFLSCTTSAAQVDRAGAAAEEVVRTIIDRLKDKWATVYQSQPINWRIWASRIARQPTAAQDGLISQPPPMEIIHLFEHSPMQHGPLFTVLREDNTTSLAILEDFDEQLRRLEEYSQRQIEICRKNIAVQIQSLREGVARHKRVAEALYSMLQAQERPDNRRRLTIIPNQDDVDHQ